MGKNAVSYLPLENSKINWNTLYMLTWGIPDNLDKTSKKEQIPRKVRDLVRARDNLTCIMCNKVDLNGYGYKNIYNGNLGRLQMHHIIPNGSATEENIVTLCNHCHQIVHGILYVEGKWRYTRVI